MMIPTVHLNGTGKQGLIDPLSAAYDALGTALDAMKQASPNGRDYYPQGSDAYGKAADEHMTRMRQVAAVQQDIEALVLAIDEGGHKVQR